MRKYSVDCISCGLLHLYLLAREYVREFKQLFIVIFGCSLRYQYSDIAKYRAHVKSKVQTGETRQFSGIGRVYLNTDRGYHKIVDIQASGRGQARIITK